MYIMGWCAGCGWWSTPVSYLLAQHIQHQRSFLSHCGAGLPLFSLFILQSCLSAILVKKNPSTMKLTLTLLATSTLAQGFAIGFKLPKDEVPKRELSFVMATPTDAAAGLPTPATGVTAAP